MIIEPLHLELEPRRPESSAHYLVRSPRDFREVLKAVGIGPVRQAPTPSHTVKRGDNLWNICSEAIKAQGRKPSRNDIHTAVLAVAKANHLSNPDLLAVGQKLDLSSIRGPAGIELRASAEVKDSPKAERAAAHIPPPSGETSTPPPVAERSATASSAVKSQKDIESVSPVISPVAQTVSATEAPTPADARGGPSLALRTGGIHAGTPLRFPQPTHAHTIADTTSPTDSIDLTALIQSIIEPGSVTLPDAAQNGPWSKVLDGPGRFTSGFGIRKDPFTGRPHFHHGIDIAAAAGTVVRPMQAGVVKSSGWEPGHGKVVVIEHPDGLETLYAHASELLVKAGDVVTADTPIAKVGSTGRSTGAHLHFEARRNNKAVDPLPYFRDESLHVAKAP
ncbi:MAG: hypothetical protein AMXMBFR4_31200 [Candidatus Hydrogenedentota bacterium]